MKYYIKLDNNKIIGWLVDVKDTKDCIELEKDVFKKNMDNGSNCYKNGVFSIEDFTTSQEKITKNQDDFRIERNNLLQKTDIEINKAIDNADVEREKSLRIYRQQLRDSTIDWVLPDNIL